MHKTMNLKGFLLIVLAMCVVFLALYLVLRSRLDAQREEENARRVTAARLEEENRDMTTQLNLLGTEDYIVSSAMANYSYMNKNDLRFEFTNPDALYAYTEEEMKILMDEISD